MKCGCEVHSHRVAIKVGPERETVPSATKQEKLWFFWVWDLRTERVQHQRPGHGVLKRPKHKWIHWLFLPVLVQNCSWTLTYPVQAELRAAPRDQVDNDDIWNPSRMQPDATNHHQITPNHMRWMTVPEKRAFISRGCGKINTIQAQITHCFCVLVCFRYYFMNVSYISRWNLGFTALSKMQ